MRLFLKNLILFICFLVVIYPILIVLTGSFVPQLFKPNITYKIGAYGHLYSRIKEVKVQKKGIDVLFLGSSHAYRGFDTRNFENVSTFNLGSSAQTPINTKVLLKRYLDKLKPGIVIYEVYPGTFEADGVESSLDIISNDKNDISSFEMACNVKNIKIYNTFIFAIYRDFVGLSDLFEENKSIAEDNYIAGGYVERTLSFNKELRALSPKKWTPNSNQLSYFKEIVSMLNERGIKLILVYAPITKSLYNSYTNNSYIDSLFKSYKVDYYNFNELMQLSDSTDFYDAHHLNQTGVNKFNKKMTEVIPQIFKVKQNEN